MKAADRRARVLIGGGGYGAGVEDHNVGLGGVGGAGKSLIAKLAFNGGAVCLGGTATKVLYEEGAHRTIVA
jgi:hypothetical protein